MGKDYGVLAAMTFFLMAASMAVFSFSGNVVNAQAADGGEGTGGDVSLFVNDTCNYTVDTVNASDHVFVPPGANETPAATLMTMDEFLQQHNRSLDSGNNASTSTSQSASSRDISAAAVTCTDSPCAISSGGTVFSYYTRHSLSGGGCGYGTSCTTPVLGLGSGCMYLDDVVSARIGFEGVGGFPSGHLYVYLDDADHESGALCALDRHDADRHYIFYRDQSTGTGSWEQYISGELAFSAFGQSDSFLPDTFFSNPDITCSYSCENRNMLYYCLCGCPVGSGRLCSDKLGQAFSYMADFEDSGTVGGWAIRNTYLYLLRRDSAFTTDTVYFSYPVSSLYSARLYFDVTGSNPGSLLPQGELEIYAVSSSGRARVFNGVVSGSATRSVDVKGYLQDSGTYFEFVSNDESKYMISNIRLEGGRCDADPDCGTNGWTGSPWCLLDDVWQSFVDYTCNNPGRFDSRCSSLETNIKRFECGDDMCGSWAYFCKSDDEYRNRICYDNGCSNAQCFSNAYTEEQIVTDCGTSGYGSNYCNNDDVYRDYISRGCSGISCFSTASPELVSDCGVDSCGAWGADYCVGDDIYHDRGCNDRGCSSAACFDNPYPESQFVQNCPNGCSAGACIIACSQDSDCGTNGLINNTVCTSDDVYDFYRTYHCNNPGTPSASCGYVDTPQLQQDCGVSNCSAWGADYCINSSVHHNRTCHDNGCSAGMCFSNMYNDEQKVKDCLNGTVCSGGTCVNALNGDVNHDCIVDIIDLAAVGLAFGSVPGDANWNLGADVNVDGRVDIIDLAAVGLNYGAAC